MTAHTGKRVEDEDLRSHEPACNEHARALLRAHGKMPAKIIRVGADSILYLNPMGKPMTAWLQTTEDGRNQRVTSEPGFPAWPE